MILVNGVETKSLSASDRGLAYGDGVFRTLAVRDGRVCAWKWHVAKLASDAQALCIPCAEEPVLREEVRRCAADAAACAVKILITRGVGRRGYALPDEIQPTRVVLRSPLPEDAAERVEHGVRVRMCSLRLGWQPALAGIKHLNRLENVLARAEWNDPAIAEGLLQDGAGSIIGGTMSNLFIVEGGHLVTPDVSRCGVAGVTRERIMAAAKECGVRCDVAEIRVDRLLAAQEVLLVNSLIGVWQVRQLDDSTWALGPVAVTVRQWLDEHEY